MIVEAVVLDFRREGFSQLYEQHKVRLSRQKCLLLQHMQACSILCSEHFMARQVEDALDQRTAELIALQKAAVEHAAASPLKSMPLQSALGAWASAAQGANAAVAADSHAHRCANTLKETYLLSSCNSMTSSPPSSPLAGMHVTLGARLSHWVPISHT